MRETLLGVLTLAICGSWGCGPGSFKGTVAGRGLNVEDAVFYVAPGDDAIPPGIEVILSDRPGLCDDLRAGRLRKNSTIFDMLLARLVNGEYIAPDKGAYAISGDAGRIGAAIFVAFDANCRSSLSASQASAASGTMEIDEFRAAPGGKLMGSFTMTIGEQAEQVTGNVAAEWCDLSTQPGSFSCE
jgi:hypothetical protein